MIDYRKDSAIIEPDAVLKMKKDTEELKENLVKTSNKLLNSTNILNEQGFQDGNFAQLHSLVTSNKENIDKLCGAMVSFSVYLAEIEKIIRSLANGPKIPTSNIQIPR